MAALPSWMTATMGEAYQTNHGWKLPLHVTVRRRSLAFARFMWATGRETYPDVPRWRLALAVARICR